MTLYMCCGLTILIRNSGPFWNSFNLQRQPTAMLLQDVHPTCGWFKQHELGPIRI